MAFVVENRKGLQNVFHLYLAPNGLESDPDSHPLAMLESVRVLYSVLIGSRCDGAWQGENTASLVLVPVRVAKVMRRVSRVGANVDPDGSVHPERSVP